MKKTILLPLLLFILNTTVVAQIKPQFLEDYNQKWVTETFNSLSLEEKIGQLLMPRGNTSGKGYDPEKLKSWVKEYKIGGVVFFAGQPSTQAKLANELQAMSKVPLLVGVDMEWGLAMRLDSTVRFPYQMALGAMQGGEDLIYRMGEEVGRQSKRMGIHINYAPVVDINNNPQNPVINFRSFGEDKIAVANKALAYMKGMQSQKIITSAKHFPGHGDTGVDSHYDLPVISHDSTYLTQNELFPYYYLIKNGLSGIMTSHLSVPSLEKTPNLAATFSEKIVSNLLIKQMKFEGLTFTDAMDMQGAIKYFPNGEALVKAILAGNDILETFEDVPNAVNAIKAAIESKKLPMEVLNERVKKILKAKAWVGLDHYQPAQLDFLVEDLNTIESDLLNRFFAEKTLVALKNKNERLPIKNLDTRTVVVAIDSEKSTPFQEMAEKYTAIEKVNFKPNLTEIEIEAEMAKIGKPENLIVGVHFQNVRPGANYGINTSNLLIIKKLMEMPQAIFVVFGNPYALGKIENLEKAQGLILANQLTKYTEEAAAQAVFGANTVNGRLPVTVNQNFKLNDGLLIPAVGRLSYGIPEMVGLDSRILNSRIDALMNLGLKEKAYPGAVMQIALHGKVIYQKAVGYHTFEQAAEGKKRLNVRRNFETGTKTDVMDNSRTNYDEGFSKKQQDILKLAGEVQTTDLFDFASVTKITTSALAAMQLVSEGKFDLDQTFGHYYPAFKGSNKENLTFRDMLTHRAGLKAWIPFWMDCIDSVATLQKAVTMQPELATEFIKTYQKQNFIQKILHLKPKYNIDYPASLQNQKGLWLKCLNTKTITWKPGIFSGNESKEFSIQVADTLFMNANRMAFIMNQIKESPVNPKQGYVYSDLHYYTYPHFVPTLVGQDWESYLKKTYRSLGAHSLTYNPRRYYDISQIVPTERDTLFRKTLIHGRVHDEGAGMLDGISGHAGLFGNANDLTKLMQMYLQKGQFGGTQFIKQDVLDHFTDYQFPYEGNRRGLAFEKLDFNKNIANGPQMASQKSYGHSGYTGTYTWVDPAHQLVYVFLSNRVYPTRDNTKISTLNIRTELGNEIIKTILKK
jgi:beta-N-acetylhexosaminidase